MRDPVIVFFHWWLRQPRESRLRMWLWQRFGFWWLIAKLGLRSPGGKA